MGPGMFDGIGTFIRFAIVAIPVLGVFALWKFIDIGFWLFHHVHIN